MDKITNRMIFGLGLLGCIGVFAVAFYLQFYVRLVPCPLCIFQRLILAALALILLIATLHNPSNKGTSRYSICSLIITFAGIATAARHVWIQHHPTAETTSCGPNLQYMLDHLPLNETFKQLLTGSGECGKIDWLFLHLSLAEWSLLCFIGFAVLVTIPLVRSCCCSKKIKEI